MSPGDSAQDFIERGRSTRNAEPEVGARGPLFSAHCRERGSRVISDQIRDLEVSDALIVHCRRVECPVQELELRVSSGPRGEILLIYETSH